jgi:hypothetical protein
VLTPAVVDPLVVDSDAVDADEGCSSTRSGVDIADGGGVAGPNDGESSNGRTPKDTNVS